VWQGGLKARWSVALFEAQDEIDRGIRSFTLPFITLHGTGDTLVDIESSRFLNNRAQSEDKTFEVNKNAFNNCMCSTSSKFEMPQFLLVIGGVENFLFQLMKDKIPWYHDILPHSDFYILINILLRNLLLWHHAIIEQV